MIRAFVTCGIVAMLFAFTPSANAAKKAKFDPETAFKKLDADNHGYLTLKEFKEITKLKKVKAKDEAKADKKLEKLFKKLDTDGDGKLTLEEFKKITEKKEKKDKKVKKAKTETQATT